MKCPLGWSTVAPIHIRCVASGRGAASPGEWRTPYFFFQAEDGIRDYKVTGVQTCALPISEGAFLHHAALAYRHVGIQEHGQRLRPRLPLAAALRVVVPVEVADLVRAVVGEIGRASCRERV